MKRWAGGAVVYQIYPRSFQDSNGDGVGDLPGITSRLDYLVDLGVTAIWLSPFYPSPMADFGYDVANYCNVDPLFGSLQDFDELLAAAHAKGLKLIVDFVPNHTSDEHPWFVESASSRDNPKHDWYIWRDTMANNWRDVLTGGSVWQWHEGRQQYYLHSFHAKQPDLNWTNPAVRAAMHDAMRFWLDRGVDGFRVDAVYWMSKHPLLADDLINPKYIPGVSLDYDKVLHHNSRGWPAVFYYLNEMADVLKEPAYAANPRFMVTEAYPELHGPLLEYLQFYAAVDPAVAAPFSFEAIGTPWQAAPWRSFLQTFHPALEQLSPLCVPSYAFGNHDVSRLRSRIGELPARAAAVLLLTLPGMAYIYNGDELGMLDGVIPADKVQDPAAGSGSSQKAMAGGRDPERTPMQWSDGAQAGFSDSHNPWLPLADNYHTVNAASETADPQSFLSLYRQLGQLRGHSQALAHGSIVVSDDSPADVLRFRRQFKNEVFDVYVNFSKVPVVCAAKAGGEVVVSSLGKPAGDQLLPYEAIVVRL